MKKSFLLLSITVLALGLSACGAKKSTSSIKSIDDLSGKKIGAQLLTTGHLFAEESYANDGKGSEVKAFSKGADAVAALKQGIIDCVIIDEQTANVFVSTNDDLTTLDEPFETEEYAICVSKENQVLLSKINTALDELKADGTFDAIVNNYIGDNKGKSSYTPDPSNNGENGKLTAATNAQFPPYEFYKEDKIVGIDAELAQAIADKLKMTLVIEDMEFDYIVASVQLGKADIGIAGMSITEERKSSVDFSTPYVNTKQVIIVKK